MFLDEGSQNPNLVSLMSVEVKLVLLPVAKLEKVVVQRLLGDVDFLRCVF